MKSNSESFEEWGVQNLDTNLEGYIENISESDIEFCWNHQQAKIDKLEKANKAQLKLLVDYDNDVGKLQKEIETLKADKELLIDGVKTLEAYGLEKKKENEMLRECLKDIRSVMDVKTYNNLDLIIHNHLKKVEDTVYGKAITEIREDK